MSSPARCMTNAGGGSFSGSGSIEDSVFTHLAMGLTFTQDRKEETIKGLHEDVMSALDKEVRALEADAWKFAAPRSQPHLFSRSGKCMFCFVTIGIVECFCDRRRTDATAELFVKFLICLASGNYCGNCLPLFVPSAFFCLWLAYTSTCRS